MYVKDRSSESASAELVEQKKIRSSSQYARPSFPPSTVSKHETPLLVNDGFCLLAQLISKQFWISEKLSTEFSLYLNGVSTQNLLLCRGLSSSHPGD